MVGGRDYLELRKIISIILFVWYSLDMWSWSDAYPSCHHNIEISNNEMGFCTFCNATRLLTIRLRGQGIVLLCSQSKEDRNWLTRQFNLLSSCWRRECKIYVSSHLSLICIKLFLAPWPLPGLIMGTSTSCDDIFLAISFDISNNNKIKF